jgi:hypothetical protein
LSSNACFFPALIRSWDSRSGLSWASKATSKKSLRESRNYKLRENLFSRVIRRLLFPALIRSRDTRSDLSWAPKATGNKRFQESGSYKLREDFFSRVTRRLLFPALIRSRDSRSGLSWAPKATEKKASENPESTDLGKPFPCHPRSVCHSSRSPSERKIKPVMGSQSHGK